MMGEATRSTRKLRVAACAIAVCGLAGLAAADQDCAYSRCAEFRLVPPPKVQRHSHRKQAGCCEAPPGWGWYRRQKLCHDCSQPLVVFDELGGVVSVHQNW